MAKVYLTGAPGCGKSTIIEKLIEAGFCAFDLDEIDDMCVWRNKQTGQIVDHHESSQEWLNNHGWSCDIDKLKKLLAKNKNVVIAGMLSNQDQFFHLFDKIIMLTCDAKTLVKRLSTRKNNLFGQTKEERNHVLSWFKDYQKRLKKSGAIAIDSRESSEDVLSNVIKNL